MDSKDPMEQVEQLLANCPYQLPDFLVTTIRTAAQDAKRRQLAAAREAAAATMASAAAAAASSGANVAAQDAARPSSSSTSSRGAPAAAGGGGGGTVPPAAAAAAAAAAPDASVNGGGGGSSSISGGGGCLQQLMLGQGLGVKRFVPQYVAPYRGSCRMQSISVKVRRDSKGGGSRQMGFMGLSDSPSKNNLVHKLMPIAQCDR